MADIIEFRKAEPAPKEEFANEEEKRAWGVQSVINAAVRDLGKMGLTDKQSAECLLQGAMLFLSDKETKAEFRKEACKAALMAVSSAANGLYGD